MRVAPVALAAMSIATAAHAQDALYEAAKREGRVTWYSVILGEEAALPLARAFEARYPGITVDHKRGNTVANATKLVNESKSGGVKGDVFDGSTTVALLLEAGLVEPYIPMSATAIPERYRDPQGRWTAVLLEFLTIGYDARKVAPADVPKRREDLLDPKWRGQMIWSASPGLTGGAGFVANTLTEMGDAAGVAYLTQLSKQDITAHNGDGHAVIGEIAKGRFPLGLQIFNHHTFLERSKGHDIRWVKMEPVLSFSNNMGLVKGAPHPSAGKLFIDFALSPEGQAIIRDGRHIPSSDKVEALEPDLKHGFRVNYVSPVLAAEKMSGWLSVYRRIFE